MPETTKLQQERMIKMQMINYKKQGYTDIKADHINYIHGQPEVVGGFMPDVSAVLNYKTTICAIATDDSMNDQHTIQRWRAFDRSSSEFHLIVPKSAINQVKDIVKCNGISVDKYWYSDNY